MAVEFRTIQKPLDCCGLINHQSRLLMMGSCFSDNIGKKLNDAFFDVDINPFGTLYNPASIARGITDIIKSRVFKRVDLFKGEADKRYHSFSHHSDFSGMRIDEVLSHINSRIGRALYYLKMGDVLVVTFGTAYAYYLKESGEVVSNCHKQPASIFERRLLDVNEIVAEWLLLIDELRRCNATLNIVFTVSPIRHLADGAHDNQLSKATLLLAIDKLVKQRAGVIYFPAYEIMNDDLRDYRFYATDMAHPTDVAVDYIYEIFARSFFSERTIRLASECEKITRRLNHRHRTDDIETITRFKASTIRELKRLRRENFEIEARCDAEITKIKY